MENSPENGKVDTPVSIETALQATGFGKFNYYLIIMCGILSGELILEMFAVGIFLPASDCDLRFSVQEKGLIAGAQMAGVVVSAYFWGFIGDTVGRRKSMIPAVIVAFLTDVITSVLSNSWAITAMRFINGFFVASGCTIPYTYLGEFHTNELRSRAIMYATAINGLFLCIVMLIAWVVTSQTWSFYIPFLDVVYKPWRFYLIVNSLPIVVSGIVLMLLPETPKFTLLQEKYQTTIETLQRMYETNRGIKKENYPYRSILQEKNISQFVQTEKRHPIFGRLQEMWYQTVPLFKPPLLSRTSLVSGIQFLIFITTRGMFMWYATIVNDVAQFQNIYPNNSTTVCNMIRANKVLRLETELEKQDYECKEILELSTFMNNLILEILFLLIVMIISFFIKYFDKIYIWLAFFIISGSCGVATSFVPIPLLATFCLIMVHTSSAYFGIFNVVIIELFPTNLRATAGCITFIIGCMGGILGSNITAILLEAHCESTFIMGGGCILAAGLLSLVIKRIERNCVEDS